MKQKLFTLIILVTFTQIFSQVITVKDKESNIQLELVIITSENPKVITETNSDGQANISLFKLANEISFQLLGYQKETISFGEIENNNFDVLLTPVNIAIDQVVISATKWSQSKKELSSKITVISPKEVELQNPQTAADLLAISGEVYIQKSQQGGGSPMLRGFATNRVLISVDGIRMNNAIFRSGNVQNVISLDPFTIENTEILFGPGSIIYGSDAIGGSMNFYTMRSQFTHTVLPFIKAHAQYRFSSANNENTGHFDINYGLNNFASLTSLSFNSYNDLTMGTNGPDEYLRNFYVKRIDGIDQIIKNDNNEKQIPSGYTQFNLMQKFRYRANENWYLDYGFHYSASSEFDRYDRLTRTSNNLPKSAVWYYGPQKWMLNNLTITNLSANKFYDDLAIRAAYQYFEESRNDRDYQDNILREREEQVSAYSVNIDFNKELNKTSKLTYGIESVVNSVKSIGNNKNILNNLSFDAQSRYPNSTWLSLAAYLVYQKYLQEDLHLQIGTRYNYFNLDSDFDTTFYPFPFTNSNVSNGAITGSIGLTYTPTKKWIFGFNISTGFRAPNVDDIGKVFDSEPGSVIIPNPDLDAEYAYNLEFNATKLFDNFLKIDFTTYYTILENAMVRRDFTLNGLDSIYYNGELSQVQALQNAANAYVYGIQTGFELSLHKNILLTSRFNYQYGKEELDDGSTSSLRHVAPLFFNTHLIYKVNKFKADLYVYYNDEISYSNLAEEERTKTYIYAIDENGNPYSPSWLTLNMKLYYKLNTTISIFSGVENILDERYRQYSSGITAPGRNFIFSAKFSL